MRRYIKAELKRNFTRKYYLNIVAILSILALGMNILFSRNTFTNNYFTTLESITGLMSSGVFFIIMFVDMVTAEEFRNNTIKNIVSSGLDRWKIVLAKTITIAITGVVAVLVVMGISLISGYILLEITDPLQISQQFKDLAFKMLGIIPLWIAAASLGNLASIITGRSNVWLLIYYFVMSIINKILGLVLFLTKKEFIGTIIKYTDISKAIGNILSNGTSLGFLNSMALNDSVKLGLIVAIINIVGYNLLAILIFNKKDL